MRLLCSVLLLFCVNVRAGGSPDLTLGAAEALLRYVATVPPLVDEQGSICIKINGQKAPLDFIDRQKGTSLHIVACGSAGSAGLVTQIPIGEPKIGPDGDYQVSFGYFVNGDEIVAGKAMSAFMRLDQEGWHVLRLQGGVWL